MKWRYLSKGEYPEKGVSVLIKTVRGFYYVAYYMECTGAYGDTMLCWRSEPWNEYLGVFFDKDIVAWCEIEEDRDV